MRTQKTPPFRERETLKFVVVTMVVPKRIFRCVLAPLSVGRSVSPVSGTKQKRQVAQRQEMVIGTLALL